MAHYAFIDENNIVVEVIPGKDESDTSENWELHYAQFREGMRCIRTSYNTLKGVHKEGGTPFRKNYAGIGFTYDSTRDAFIPPKPDDCEELNEETCTWIPPQPFASWTFNTSNGDWEAPVAYPTDDKKYIWDEATASWIEV